MSKWHDLEIVQALNELRKHQHAGYQHGCDDRGRQKWHALRPLAMPLMAGCGVFPRADAQGLLAAGAVAVQVDTALWKGYLLDGGEE